MKVLFLGGTGNISTDCAARLDQLGHDIFVVSRGRNPVPAHYRTIAADRKDPAAMRHAVKDLGVDVVINFLGYELSDVQLDYDLFKERVGQYIFISSATVYEKPPRHLPIREEGPFGNPFWEYAAKKLVCEQWLQARFAEDRFPVLIVRPSHTYSHRWVPNPVSSSSFTFAKRLQDGQPVYVPDDGENRWTLTTASDFAVGLAGLVGNEKAVGECFHITSDEVLTWNGIVQEIAAALGATSPQVIKVPTEFICQIAPQMTGTLKGDKSHPGVFDNSKIKRFVPEFGHGKPFRIGVRESIEWLRARPDRQNLSPQVDEVCEAVTRAWLGREAQLR